MNTVPFPLAPTVSALAMVLITSSHAATVYVDNDAPFGGDGTTWNTAYRFLSDGLAAAAPGEIIKVGAGTHRPDESTAFPGGSGNITLFFTLKDGQELRGGYAGYGAPAPDERDLDLYPTTLSGDLDDDDEPDSVNRDDNSFHVVDLGDRIDVILDGLTIRGGHADAGSYSGAGVSIRFGLATVKHCRIIDNRALSGAGIAAYDASIEIEDCEFRGNLAAGQSGTGGAVSAKGGSSLSVRQCEFHDNVASTGGGVYANDGGTVVLRDNLFQGNFAMSAGGAATLVLLASIDILRCDTRNNTAASSIAGGMLADGLEITVQDSTFTNNSAGFFGGGLVVGGGAAMITNCLFSRNTSARGAGLYVAGPAVIGNCSFSRNDGQGLQLEGSDASAVVRNSIFWGNTPVQIQGAATVYYCCIEGGESGGTNINEDPLFVQAGTDNLRLSEGSPCVDTGYNIAVPPGVVFDLAGNLRIANGTVDMGCYEGAFTALPEAASATDLDQGEPTILSIDGSGWDPLHQTTLVIVNITGEDNASLVATLLDQPDPVPGGFSVNGKVIQIETEGMNDGEFSVQIFAPVDPELLDGADPLRLDVTRLHDTGVWSLAVASNSVNSPDTFGPIGDRIAAVAPEPLGISSQIGDYGVWWDAAAQEGVVWSNVDRQGMYAVGVPQHPADCEQPPNGFVDFHDLLFVIGYWGAGAGPFDVDDSGVVGLLDIVELLSRWGACP